jgi:hypothetical protein
MDRDELIGHLLRVFPQEEFCGNPAPHDCVECSEIRNALSGATWTDIPPDFLDGHDGDLPLLTREAYVLFLPAWLREAVLRPNGAVAGMLMVNLGEKVNTVGFSSSQAWVILQIAHYIARNNTFGVKDPVNLEAVTQIESVWANHAD